MPPATPQSPAPSTPPPVVVSHSRKKWVWTGVILVVLLILGGVAYASPLLRALVVGKIVDVTPVPSLDVTPTNGSLPLTVKVTYPQEWQSLIDEECSHATPIQRLGGTAFTIDWGDGRSGPPCESHTYTAAGTFDIKAKIYSFDDIPHPDWGGFSKDKWKAAATIRVSGTGAQPSVELLEPQGGESFNYQEFPDIKWRITTGRKLTLQIDLLDQDGRPFASETKNDVAYEGEGSITYLQPQTFDAYDALLRDGKTKFSVRVALLDNGQVVAEKISSDLSMSANWSNKVNGGLRISPTSGSAPLTVKLDYGIWHPSCISYRLDWGDQSSPDTLIQPTQKSCVLDSQTKTFSHTFTKAGTYTIVMKSNNLDTFKNLENIVKYESVTVTVK